MGWKSLRGVILRAPLCGANNENDNPGTTLLYPLRQKPTIEPCAELWLVMTMMMMMGMMRMRRRRKTMMMMMTLITLIINRLVRP